MEEDELARRAGLVLPPPPKPIGAFAPVVRCGDLLFLSGLSPDVAGQPPTRGLVGADMSAEEAREQARHVGINLLAVLQAELGTLSRVSAIVKLTGFVRATPDFERHPFVIDGCSMLLEQVFHHLGPHARTSVGVSSLPNGIPVEIEMVARFA